VALFSAAGLPNLSFRCLTASPSSHGRHAGLPTLARPRRVPIGAKQAHPPLLTQGKGAAPCDRGYTRKNLKFLYLCQQYEFCASYQLYILTFWRSHDPGFASRCECAFQLKRLHLVLSCWHALNAYKRKAEKLQCEPLEAPGLFAREHLAQSSRSKVEDVNVSDIAQRVKENTPCRKYY